MRVAAEDVEINLRMDPSSRGGRTTAGPDARQHAPTGSSCQTGCQTGFPTLVGQDRLGGAAASLRVWGSWPPESRYVNWQRDGRPRALEHATTLLLGLAGVAVERVERVDGRTRRVHVSTADATAAACPGCGVVSNSPKQYVTTRPKDLPHGSPQNSEIEPLHLC